MNEENDTYSGYTLESPIGAGTFGTDFRELTYGNSLKGYSIEGALSHRRISLDFRHTDDKGNFTEKIHYIPSTKPFEDFIKLILRHIKPIPIPVPILIGVPIFR